MDAWRLRPVLQLSDAPPTEKDAEDAEDADAPPPLPVAEQQQQQGNLYQAATDSEPVAVAEWCAGGTF